MGVRRKKKRGLPPLHDLSQNPKAETKSRKDEKENSKEKTPHHVQHPNRILKKERA